MVMKTEDTKCVFTREIKPAYDVTGGDSHQQTKGTKNCVRLQQWVSWSKVCWVNESSTQIWKYNNETV